MRHEAAPGILDAGSAATRVVDIAKLRADVEAVINRLRSEWDGEVYPAAVEGTRPDALAVAVALIDGRGFVVFFIAPRLPPRLP